MVHEHSIYKHDKLMSDKINLKCMCLKQRSQSPKTCFHAERRFATRIAEHTHQIVTHHLLTSAEVVDCGGHSSLFYMRRPYCLLR